MPPGHLVNDDQWTPENTCTHNGRGWVNWLRRQPPAGTTGRRL